MTTRSPAALRAALTALALHALAFGQQADDHKRPEQGDTAPDVTLVDAATGDAVKLHAALAAGPADAPLVLAFVHKDKELCVRFVEELGKRAQRLEDAQSRCAVYLVFCGQEREGAAIAAARALPAPFRLLWDPDRSAYEAMGLIAFPTVYVIDRSTRRIDLLRRGYKVSLAQEVGLQLEVALGLLSDGERRQLESPSDAVSERDRQRRARVRQAQLLLRTGKHETALAAFEAILADEPDDPDARAGRAIAASLLGRDDAYELLTALRKTAPDNHEVTLALAGWLLDRGRHDDAEPLIRGALERAPAPAHFALGRLLEARGEWRAAAAAYRVAAERWRVAGTRTP